MTEHAVFTKINKEWKYIAVIVFISFVLILPIGIFGIPSGTDLPQHFQFAQTYYDSIVNGDGFPNWSSRENHGYGSPGIRFYPPVAYYTLAFVKILIGDWFIATWLVFTFWMALSCIGIYYWARWWLDPRESMIAGILFGFFPFHLNQLFISFIYADFAGAAILTFCFAFLTRVMRRNKNVDILGLAVSYALLIMTHLPSTVIGSMSLAIYGLILIPEKKLFFRKTAAAALGAALGVMASAYYWFPMLTEMAWVKHATERYQTGHYYFGNRLFPLYWNSIATDYKPHLLLSDKLTLISLLFLVSAAVYFFYRKTKNFQQTRESQIFRFVLPIGIFAFFMVSELSYPVWKVITPIQKVQFPMRWMPIVGMCGSLVTAGAFHFLVRGKLLQKRIWMYSSIIFISIFLILDITYFLYPSAMVPIKPTKFVENMKTLPEKQNCECWWSVWSEMPALKIKERVSTENSRIVKTTEWEPETRSFVVEEGEATNLRISTFYYPRWQAEINGKESTVKHDENGAIEISIPSEQSMVRLRFQEPVSYRFSSLASIIAWVGIFLSIILLTQRRKFL